MKAKELHNCEFNNSSTGLEYQTKIDLKHSEIQLS